MNLAILSIFIAYVFYHELNISYRVRRLFKLSMSKPYKLIDCYPCQSMWIALLITQDLYVTMLCYMIAVIIEKK